VRFTTKKYRSGPQHIEVGGNTVSLVHEVTVRTDRRGGHGTPSIEPAAIFVIHEGGVTRLGVARRNAGRIAAIAAALLALYQLRRLGRTRP
jgi:hypothetical protein